MVVATDIFTWAVYAVIGVSDFQFVSCSSPAEIVLTEGVGRIDVEIQQDDVVESIIMEKFYVWIYIGSQRQESRAVVYIQDMSCEFMSVLMTSLFCVCVCVCMFVRAGP